MKTEKKFAIISEMFANNELTEVVELDVKADIACKTIMYSESEKSDGTGDKGIYTLRLTNIAGISGEVESLLQRVRAYGDTLQEAKEVRTIDGKDEMVKAYKHKSESMEFIRQVKQSNERLYPVIVKLRFAPANGEATKNISISDICDC